MALLRPLVGWLELSDGLVAQNADCLGTRHKWEWLLMPNPLVHHKACAAIEGEAANRVKIRLLCRLVGRGKEANQRLALERNESLRVLVVPLEELCTSDLDCLRLTSNLSFERRALHSSGLGS